MAEPTATVYPAYGPGAPSGDFYVLAPQLTYGPYTQDGTSAPSFDTYATNDFSDPDYSE
jgi:hypothetical protein